MRDVFIVEAKRSPVGRKGGVFNALRPDDLLTQVLRGLMEAVPALPREDIDEVVIGCAIPEAEQGMNVARMASLLAGVPNSVPAYTVNRFCASGLQAIEEARLLLQSGQAEVVLAGGVESMSCMPRMGGHQVKPNPRVTREEALSPMAWSMGLAAEHLAQRYAIPREVQDQFALNSHLKALEALDHGAFDQEIIPVLVERCQPGADAKVDHTRRSIKADEGPRADTSFQKLSELAPVFRIGGTVTSGNASQMSDGAAAVLLMSETGLKRYGLRPLARCISYAAIGIAPELMGLGPSVAVPKALKRAGLSLEDIDWIELNEAFAAQALAVMQDLALDPTRLNPLGGAIALGHPLGATGAIRVTTLVHAMQRSLCRRGLVTTCVGMGMGVASVFEKMD